MEENKIIYFFSKHWSKLLLGLLALASLFAWSEKFYKSNKFKSKQDFILANQIFEQFYKGEMLPQESIETAENILKRHPELHPKYDSLLSLSFFAQSNKEKALHYARSITKQGHNQLPEPYQNFAQTSILIAEEHFTEAFTASQALEAQIENQENFATLEALNTLRLLFLAGHLGHDNERRIYWDKLEKHPQFSTLNAVFQEGQLSLSDYFQ